MPRAIRKQKRCDRKAGTESGSEAETMTILATSISVCLGLTAAANVGPSKFLTLQTPAKEDYREIKCRVLDADGRPISAVVRERYRIGGRLSQTHYAPMPAEGAINYVPRSAEAAWFSADVGNQFSWGWVRPRRGQVTLRLHRVKLASISGSVRDSAGKPIIAKVTLGSLTSNAAINRDPWGSNGEFNITGTDGRYVFNAIYPGITAFVMVQARSHIDFQSKIYRVKTGHSLIISPIYLQKGHTISGRVVDQYGKPIFDAVVRFEKASRVGEISQRTDMDGKFLCDRLPKGRYKISISSGGKTTRLTGVTDTNAIYRLAL